VTSLARIITGWTIAGRAGKLGEPGTFVFNPNAHEPGPQILLGKAYAPGGTRQGEAALLDLARHKATANHIATKLCRHFVGAIAGGRVIADWPGLKDTQLYQNRDLAPTADLRAALKGVLADQFGLSVAALGDAVFPESSRVKPMKGLVAG
jgi:uncharacterized protein (DUF1800 family)